MTKDSQINSIINNLENLKGRIITFTLNQLDNEGISIQEFLKNQYKYNFSLAPKDKQNVSHPVEQIGLVYELFAGIKKQLKK